MSVSQKPEYRRGGGDRRLLLAINPRGRLLGDVVDGIMDVGVTYSGTVARVDNMSRIEDPAQFYTNAELLERDEEVEAWYDSAYIMDDEGLEDRDAHEILRRVDMVEYVGGPLADIGRVHESLEDHDRDSTSYRLVLPLVSDYGSWTPENGPGEKDDWIRMSRLLESSPDNASKRLENAGLGDIDH